MFNIPGLNVSLWAAYLTTHTSDFSSVGQDIYIKSVDDRNRSTFLECIIASTNKLKHTSHSKFDSYEPLNNQNKAEHNKTKR